MFAHSAGASRSSGASAAPTSTFARELLSTCVSGFSSLTRALWRLAALMSSTVDTTASSSAQTRDRREELDELDDSESSEEEGQQPTTPDERHPVTLSFGLTPQQIDLLVAASAGAAYPAQLQATLSLASSSAASSAPSTSRSAIQRAKPSTSRGEEQQGRVGSLVWTSGEVEKLLELHGRGMEWSDIARELPGRTDTACRRKYARMQEAGQIPASKAPQSTPAQASQQATITPAPAPHHPQAFKQGAAASGSGSPILAVGPPPLQRSAAISPAAGPSQPKKRSREAAGEDTQGGARPQGRREDRGQGTGRTEGSDKNQGQSLKPVAAASPLLKPFHIPSASLSGSRGISANEVPFSPKDDSNILAFQQLYPGQFEVISKLLRPVRRANEVEDRLQLLRRLNVYSGPQTSPSFTSSPSISRAAAPSRESQSFTEPGANQRRRIG
ncbi:hypothetical protein JCM5296_000924 [Sporobolomyces johnsonii]